MGECLRLPDLRPHVRAIRRGPIDQWRDVSGESQLCGSCCRRSRELLQRYLWGRHSWRCICNRRTCRCRCLCRWKRWRLRRWWKWRLRRRRRWKLWWRGRMLSRGCFDVMVTNLEGNRSRFEAIGVGGGFLALGSGYPTCLLSCTYYEMGN